MYKDEPYVFADDPDLDSLIRARFTAPRRILLVDRRRRERADAER